MVTASVDLTRLAAYLLLGLRPAHPAGQHLDQRLVGRMRCEPLRGEPGVEELQGRVDPLLLAEARQLLEGIRGRTRSAGRRAQQRQALDPLGPRDRDLLGDHAAEADPHDAEAIPADLVGEAHRVRRVLGHRVRRRRDLRAPETALVVRNDVEALGERCDEQRAAFERRPGPVAEEQRWSAARAFVVDRDSVRGDRRHRRSLCTPCASPVRRRARGRTATAVFPATETRAAPGRADRGVGSGDAQVRRRRVRRAADG